MSDTSHIDHFKDKAAAKEAARAALLPVPRGRIRSPWDSFVTFMRRALPVMAIIAGIITIAYPLLNENEVSFTLSTDDVLKGDDTVHMKSLKYRGTDTINRLFTVTAESGLQKDPNAPSVSLTGIRASIQMKDAGVAIVTARTGRYERKEALLSLIGGVNLETSGGYSLNMNGADVYLRGRQAKGNGGINGQTPLGTLSSDGFSVDVDKTIAEFKGRVKLHIIPKKIKEKKEKGNDQ